MLVTLPLVVLKDTLVLLELQVPPAVASLADTDEPVHTTDALNIAATTGGDGHVAVRLMRLLVKSEI